MRRCDGTLRRCAGAIYGEIKRRCEVVGVFPNEAGVTRLIPPCCSNRTMNGPSSVPAT